VAHGNEQLVGVILERLELMVDIEATSILVQRSTTTPTDATCDVFFQLL
jgi:hypothetical protein